MKKYIIWGLIGALAGFLFFYIIGCNIGTCVLSSSPLKSSLLGLSIGIFLALDLKPKKKDIIENEIVDKKD